MYAIMSNLSRFLLPLDVDLTTRSTTTPAQVTLSSIEIGSASEVIDANKAGNFKDGTCIRTQQGQSPWVVIDLGLVADVYAVQITTPNPQGMHLILLSFSFHCFNFVVFFKKSNWFDESVCFMVKRMLLFDIYCSF